jgi:N-methyl-L-proline demethylase
MRNTAATDRHNRSHPGMTIAEYLTERAEELELVTPDRTIAPEIGSTNYPAYIRALNAANTKVTMNLQIERLERRGNKIATHFNNEYAKREIVKKVDQVVIEYCTVPLDDVYFSLKDASINRGEINYKAFIAGKSQSLIFCPSLLRWVGRRQPHIP